MSTRHSHTIARTAFVLCGIGALLLGRVYWSLRSSGFSQSSSGVFTAILVGIGAFDIVVALFPLLWMKSDRQINDENLQRLQTPLKMLIAFAVASFIATVTLTFAPLRWHLGPQLVFMMCPAAVLTITVDPSPAAALLILAPISAAAYGSLGGALGYIFVELGRRLQRPEL
jgi:hypothetical protein